MKFGDDLGYLYLLAGHQSTVYEYMAFRMMKYWMAIIDYHRNNHPKDEHLQPVYPMIIHNGRRKYTATLDFFELFIHKEMAKSLFIEPILLINSENLSDKDMLELAIPNLMIFMLKHIND